MTGQGLPVATLPVATLPWARRVLRAALSAFLLVVLPAASAQSGRAQASPQTGPYERTYTQSKSAVEKALKELQPSMRGRLPVLEGFALPGDHPLNQYRRAYYQSAVQVSSTASGGSVVRVNSKVTAWYTDSTPSRSGYQLLPSNGRIESDLLDQLSDLLGSSADATNSGGSSSGRFSGDRSTGGVRQAVSNPGKRSCGHRGTRDLGADAPVAGNRARVLVFIGTGPVQSATGGDEKFAEQSCRSSGSQVAGGGGELGGSAQQPGASQESGRHKENRDASSCVSQFGGQDFVFGDRAR